MRAMKFGAGLAAFFAFAALLSYLWTPYDVAALDIAAKLQPPSAAHWLGTDHFGRDVLSMLMVGARVSIAVALVAVGIGMGVGVPLGLVAAARRGSLVDEAIMRGNDLVFAFPALLIAIMITAVLGPSALNAIVAIGHLQHPGLRPGRRPSSAEPVRTSRNAAGAGGGDARGERLGAGQDVRREGDPVAVVDVADGLAAVGLALVGGLDAGGVAVVLGLAVAGLDDCVWSWVVSAAWPPPPPSVYSASKTPKMLALGSCSPSALVLMVPEQPVAEVMGWPWLSWPRT